MSYGGKEKNCQWPKKKGDFTHHSHIGLLDAREARIAEVQQEQWEAGLVKGRDICVFLELGGNPLSALLFSWSVISGDDNS